MSASRAKARRQSVEKKWLETWGKETGPPIVVCARKGNSPLAAQKCVGLQSEIGCSCPTGDRAKEFAQVATRLTHHAIRRKRTVPLKECEACGRYVKTRCHGLCERCNSRLQREAREKRYQCQMCKKQASYSAATLCEICARVAFKGRR